MHGPPDDRSEVQIPEEHVNAAYTVLANRRTAFDTLVWQVPSLGLAAQAFLLTLAYGPSTSSPARCIAASLSIVVAVVAIQTMMKHRANERTDTLLLEKIERELGISIGHGGRPHNSPQKRGKAIGNDLVERLWARPRSVVLWLVSLSCFATAGFICIGLTLLSPHSLRG
jgi:hypothetical protein